MKFVLGLVAIIIVSLAVYVTMDSDGKQQVQKKVTKAAQPKEKVSQVVPAEVKAKKSSVKNITVKSPKVVSELPSHGNAEETMQDEEEIGKGLTLESIENADVSDEEKDRMRDDLAYRQGIEAPYEAPPSEKEILNMIEDDLKNGLR